MKRKIIAGMLMLLLEAFIITGCNSEKGNISDIDEEQMAENGEKSETESAVEEAVLPAETAETENAMEVKADFYRVINPSPEYYFADGQPDMAAQSVKLEKVSENANQITDEQAWFAENELTKPSFPYHDGTYRYEVQGENGFDVYQLELYDAVTGERAAGLDFSDYRYGNDFSEENRLFVEQRICYAKAEDGILYVSIAHNTYAESSPHTAYLVAIDLKDCHVIWKTAPLTCNAVLFEIIYDAIVCGYGFTAEDDYLNIIDKGTGSLQEQIPLKSKADYILQKDGMLYVRTYNTNDVFKIIRLQDDSL